MPSSEPFIAHTTLEIPGRGVASLQITQELELYCDNEVIRSYSPAGLLCLAALMRAKNCLQSAGQIRAGVEEIHAEFSPYITPDNYFTRDQRRAENFKGELQIGPGVNDVLKRGVIQRNIARIGRRPFQAVILYDWDGDPESAEKILSPFFEREKNGPAVRQKDEFLATLRTKLLADRRNLDMEQGRSINTQGDIQDTVPDELLPSYANPRLTRRLMATNNRGIEIVSINDVRYMQRQDSDEEKHKQLRIFRRMPICHSGGSVELAQNRKIEIMRIYDNIQQYFRRNLEDPKPLHDLFGASSSVINLLAYNEAYRADGEIVELDALVDKICEFIDPNSESDQLEGLVREDINRFIQEHCVIKAGLTEIGKRLVPSYEQGNLVSLRLGIQKKRRTRK